MPRELFWDIIGRRTVVGHCFNAVDYATRKITTKPLKPINSANDYFFMLESQLRERGYDPIIYASGQIYLCIPCNDKYGWVLREIARTYWLTLHKEGKMGE